MLTTNQILQQGRYRIVNQLGQNGTGFGYEAFDTVLNTNVLLREIRDNLGKVTTPAQIETRKATFAEKGKFLTEMKHESLLTVKDFFSEIDRHYLVTEFVGGSNLGELIEKKKSPFPLTDVANWADSLLDALNYLHTLSPQIIHGEVKPQNVWLAPNGKVKLMIFNLVRSTDEINPATANQTFDAAVLPYLPLEQIWDGLDSASQKVILTNYDEKSEKILEQAPDARSDVYSIAAALYHLLTARIPTDALTRSIDILEGKNDPLQPPCKINQSVPQEVSDVLMKALEIKRENRFSSAVIMRQVLRTAFARAKEREVTAVKPIQIEDDAVLEIPIVEPKPVVPQQSIPAPKSSEIESEQARQLELIKQQLREAEERRLEAEKRAAEAEKRLIEAEKHISVEPNVETPVVAESLPVEKEIVREPASITQAEVLPAPLKETATDYPVDDFSEMFAESQKEGGAFKKVAAAAVALIVLGGAGFGIWTFTKSKSIEPAQTTSNAAIPAPSVESTPAPAADTAPSSSYQATSEQNSSNSEPTTAPASSNPTAVKVKTTATPTPPQTAQAKKPAATPAKTEEKPKKVTLDDLLKDN